MIAWMGGIETVRIVHRYSAIVLLFVSIAEFIMIYPPGIPVLLPGERITRTNIHYIREHMRVGLSVQGAGGPETPRWPSSPKRIRTNPNESESLAQISG